MKKLSLILLLVITIGINSLFATPNNEDSGNPFKKFADSIAHTVFKTAWPTAKYKDIEVCEHEEVASGYKIILKFRGNSSMCMMGSCPLWFKLKVKTDFEFHIENMEVLKHNAILQPPFKTTGAIAQAMLEANNR